MVSFQLGWRAENHRLLLIWAPRKPLNERMGAAQRNPSARDRGPRNTVGFAALQPRYPPLPILCADPKGCASGSRRDRPHANPERRR